MLFVNICSHFSALGNNPHDNDNMSFNVLLMGVEWELLVGRAYPRDEVVFKRLNSSFGSILPVNMRGEFHLA
jgi:hypothetical protein